MNFGKTAYEAYCKTTDNKSLISGAELPTWEDLKPEIQEAWTAAGYAVGNVWADEIFLKPRAQEIKEAARRGFEGIQQLHAKRTAIQHTCSSGHTYEANPYEPCPKCAKLDQNRALD